MRVGTHVSIAGGIWNAPSNAAKVGAEVFQIFSRSPHGGPVKEITGETVKKFGEEMKKHGLDTFYIHTPYFINLGSVKNNIYYGSISVLREELERGSLLGCRAVMTHIGSFGELTEKEGVEWVVKALDKVLEGYKGTTQLLLEISAGAGRIIGDTFEEIAEILDHPKLKKQSLAVCFDTCHAFASGYDLRTKPEIEKTMKQFDKLIGFEKLIMIHANDSLAELGKHLDRHQNIGEGHIGMEGFKVMAKHKHLSKLDWILETPKDDPKADPQNISVLKKLRI
ncbi:MAG TPA: deoxyribonuclease IV [Patescibacteria group bacterium]|jgi:deoxyribonuclease-4|nr:deoxyribonuclease IV [Patescibacteria group bacterium]